MKRTYLCLIFLPFFIFVSSALGDGYEEQPRPAGTAAQKKLTPPASENFGKTNKFLPGEEVVSPTGQKMKVWSTEGPVPVSRPPEPFEDREKSVLDNSHIVVDTEAIRKNRKTSSPSDSFDIRPENQRSRP